MRDSNLPVPPEQPAIQASVNLLLRVIRAIELEVTPTKKGGLPRLLSIRCLAYFFQLSKLSMLWALPSS